MNVFEGHLSNFWTSERIIIIVDSSVVEANFSWTWKKLKKLKYCFSMKESVKHVFSWFYYIIDQFWNGTQTMRQLNYLLLIRSGNWYESINSFELKFVAQVSFYSS